MTVTLLAVCVVPFYTVAALTNSGSGTDHALSGRVVNNDGRPITGATVFVTADPSFTKATDEEGRFHFCATEMKRLLKKAAVDKPSRGLDLVAVSEGFGVEWIKVRRYATASSDGDLNGAATRNITLRLTKEFPIRGRFVNGDNAPISNVEVELGQALVLPDVPRWLKEWETSRRKSCWRLASYAEKRYQPVRRRFLFPAGRPVPVSNEPGFSTTFTTDKDGSFSIRGVGREQVVWLIARHPNFVTKTIFVTAREPFTLKPANTELPPLYPATFTQALEPGKPIKGIVRERGTGIPLAGATVCMSMYPPKESGVAKATTADDGTFRIRGLGEAESYRCVVFAAKGQPHLRRVYSIDSPPGLKPLDVNVELFRGSVIDGVVKNKKTGERLFGADLVYFPASGHANLDGLRESGDGAWDDRLRTGLGGSFSMAIPPGPGLIGVRVGWDRMDEQFRRCRKDDFPYPLEEEDGEFFYRSATDQIVQPKHFHAVVKVNPTKDRESYPISIEIEPQ